MDHLGSNYNHYGSIGDIPDESELLALAHDQKQPKLALDQLHSDLHPPIGRGKATILSEVFNISKNLIGGGVLSLSGGIALFADDSQAVIAAVLWILVLGAVFGYFCLL